MKKLLIISCIILLVLPVVYFVLKWKDGNKKENNPSESSRSIKEDSNEHIKKESFDKTNPIEIPVPIDNTKDNKDEQLEKFVVNDKKDEESNVVNLDKNPSKTQCGSEDCSTLPHNNVIEIEKETITNDLCSQEASKPIIEEKPESQHIILDKNVKEDNLSQCKSDSQNILDADVKCYAEKETSEKISVNPNGTQTEHSLPINDTDDNSNVESQDSKQNGIILSNGNIINDTDNSKVEPKQSKNSLSKGNIINSIDNSNI
ncbi:hypothetical protein NGRA_3414, partial [Nosema granulosis]